MIDENENAFLDEDEGIIELEDTEGNVTRFEFVDRAEMDGAIYYALIPADIDDEENSEFVVLKEITDENGETMLSTVDDDEEYEAAGEMFIKRFANIAEDAGE